jgi:hypothetical protein
MDMRSIKSRPLPVTLTDSLLLHLLHLHQTHLSLHLLQSSISLHLLQTASYRHLRHLTTIRVLQV